MFALSAGLFQKPMISVRPAGMTFQRVHYMLWPPYHISMLLAQFCGTETLGHGLGESDWFFFLFFQCLGKLTLEKANVRFNLH